MEALPVDLASHLSLRVRVHRTSCQTQAWDLLGEPPDPPTHPTRTHKSGSPQDLTSHPQETGRDRTTPPTARDTVVILLRGRRRLQGTTTTVGALVDTLLRATSRPGTPLSTPTIMPTTLTPDLILGTSTGATTGPADSTLRWAVTNSTTARPAGAVGAGAPPAPTRGQTTPAGTRSTKLNIIHTFTKKVTTTTL